MTLPQRTVVITGANSGIGFQAASAVLARDPEAIVVVAGRDERRITQAVRKLGSKRAVARSLDLASLASVTAFASALRRDVESGVLPPIAALVHNAGLQVIGPAQFSEDGHELTFAVNHLGHFALTLFLIEALPTGSRIVVVSSDTHDPAAKTGMPAPRYRSAALLAAAGYPSDSEGSELKVGQMRYTTSKLCNLLFAYELDRRLKAEQWGKRQITVNVFNPGLTPGTGLARTYPASIRFMFRHMLPLLAHFTGRLATPRAQGCALARLALDPSLAGSSAGYYSGLEIARSSPESHDLSKAQNLWETSESLLRDANPA